MREPQISGIRDELIGELAVGQVPTIFGQVTAPLTEMDLVNRDRRFAIVPLPPLRYPLSVLP